MEVPSFPRLHDYVAHWARHAPDREAAVLPDDLRWTWRELAAQVDSTASALLSHGVRRGDRVAVYGLPRPEFLATYLAVAGIGAVFHGLNPKYRRAELDYVLGDSEPVAVVDLLGTPVSTALLAQLADQVSSVRGVFCWPLATGDVVVGSDDLAAARDAVDTADPAVLVHTSGSSGRPKGALLPHRGLTFCSVVQADHWLDEPGQRVLCNLPINHVGCLGDLCAASVVAGATLVFQERFDAVEALRLIAAERIGFWGAVPAVFALCVRSPAWPDADLSSLRRIIWSGGAMPLPVARELVARCPRVSNAYGMTETVGSVTYTDDSDPLETICATVGRPDERYEVRVARADGTTCDADEDGEILVRGDFLMGGYLGRPDATAEAIDTEGWLHTGDVARARPDGALVLVGRRSEMFKSGGYNVYPREVELAIEEQPSVGLAAVVDEPDEVFGHVGHAFVVPAGAVRPDVDVLRTALRDRLANYKVPKRFTVLDELPMLPVGKVDKVALRGRLVP